MKNTFFKIYYGPSFRTAEVGTKDFVLPASLSALNGRSVLFITDIHLSAMFPLSAAERLIDQANALCPDLICMGGDYAETGEDQAALMPLLARLRAPLGCYAVLGNNDHEHLLHNGVNLSDALQRVGITLLSDQEAAVQADGCRILIGGLNAYNMETTPSQPFFIGSDEHDFRIVLTHYPQSIPLHRADYAAQPHLGLAGHTHGGQFCFLGLTPYSIGFERLKKSHLMPAAGWTDRPGFPTLISAGIGTSRLPFRLNVPPRLELIHLTAGQKI